VAAWCFVMGRERGGGRGGAGTVARDALLRPQTRATFTTRHMHVQARHRNEGRTQCVEWFPERDPQHHLEPIGSHDRTLCCVCVRVYMYVRVRVCLCAGVCVFSFPYASVCGNALCEVGEACGAGVPSCTVRYPCAADCPWSSTTSSCPTASGLVSVGGGAQARWHVWGAAKCA
jgi:hypothetical protein